MAKMGMGLDPNGKAWSQDKAKYGYKMLQKMGWEEQKGLGANGQGRTDHVIVKRKLDNAGVGVSSARDVVGSAWLSHSSDFSGLLARLNKAYVPNNETNKEEEESSSDSSSSDESEEEEKKEDGKGGLNSDKIKSRYGFRRSIREKNASGYSTEALSQITGRDKAKDEEKQRQEQELKEKAEKQKQELERLKNEELLKIQQAQAQQQNNKKRKKHEEKEIVNNNMNTDQEKKKSKRKKKKSKLNSEEAPIIETTIVSTTTTTTTTINPTEVVIEKKQEVEVTHGLTTTESTIDMVQYFRLKMEAKRLAEKAKLESSGVKQAENTEAVISDLDKVLEDVAKIGAAKQGKLVYEGTHITFN